MRKLASIQEIIDIKPIENADAIELAIINGWQCVVAKKDNFKVGDKVIYCEIDSILPPAPEFEFLKDRKYRVKTIKLRGQISQGLVLPLSYLPKGNYNIDDDVTEIIGITKYEPDENNDANKKVITNKKWVKKYIPDVVLSFMFSHFPKLSKKLFTNTVIKKGFPDFINKTDEERIQNLKNLINEVAGMKFVGTEKIDGSSETIYLKDNKFYVCSRNNQLDKDDGSKYWQVVKEQDIESKIRKYFKNRNIALQGELCGEGIQGNKYKIKGIDIYIFDIFDIDKQEYYNQYEVERITKEIGLKSVPIIYRDFVLPNDINEILKLAEGKSVVNNSNIEREGIVWRLAKPENNKVRISFKSISNKFLLKNE